jgi:hypothetical protein
MKSIEQQIYQHIEQQKFAEAIEFLFAQPNSHCFG